MLKQEQEEEALSFRAQRRRNLTTTVSAAKLTYNAPGFLVGVPPALIGGIREG